jgi:hypothetical protein
MTPTPTPVLIRIMRQLSWQAAAEKATDGPVEVAWVEGLSAISYRVYLKS